MEPPFDLNNPPPVEPEHRTWWGRALRALAALLVLVVLLVLGAVAVLQTPWGSRKAVDAIVRLANPYQDATLDVGGIDGSWINGIDLYDLRLTRRDGSPMATIDTLQARYDLLDLLQNRLTLRDGYLAGAYLNFRQGPDRVFDIQVPFLPDTLEVVDDSLKGKGLQLRFDRLRVRRSNADFAFYHPTKDSVYALRNFSGTARDVLVTDEVKLTFDALGSDFILPDSAGRGRLDTRALALDRNLLTIGDLRLVSQDRAGAPRSNVAARGTLRLPADSTETLRDANFTLRAAPFALADLTPFVPRLNPDATLALDGTVKGSLDRLLLDLTGATGDGATLALRGSLRPSTKDSLSVDLAAEVREFDYGYFTTPTGNRVSADARANVRGEELASISGPVNVVLRGGQIGNTLLPRGTLDAEFTRGVADLALATTYNGASVRVAGMLAPFEERRRYDLTARFQDLNLARFAPGAQPSDLGGTLRVRGEGTDLRTMSANASLDLDASRVGPYRLTAGDAAVSIRRGGLVDFGVRLAVPEGRLQLAGDTRLPPGNDWQRLSYRITDGRVENFDVAAFTGQAVRSNVNGRFTAAGTGIDPKTMRLDADVTLGPTFWGDYRVDGANLAAVLRNGRVQTDLDARGVVLPEGRVGRLTLASNLDIRNLGSDAFRRQTVDVDLDVAETTFRQFNITGARLRARTPLGGGPITFSLDGRTNVGTLDVAGTADVLGGRQRVNLTRGRFENLNLATITNNPAQESDLTGTLTGTVDGFDPKTMRADVRLRLEPSRYADQRIDRADATLRLDRGALAFNADAATPGGGARLVGRARPFDAVPTYAVSEGVLRRIDVGAFTGNDSLSTDLNGRFTLDGRGFDPKTLAATLRLDLDESRINATTIQQGRLDATLRDGQTVADLDATTNGGRLALAAQGRFFDEVPTYALRGGLFDVSVGALLGRDSLDAGGTLRFDVSGTGIDPQTMRLAGTVTGDSARYETIRVDTLYGRFAYDAGLLDLDTLYARSNVADADAGGRVALFDTTQASDLRAAVVLRDLLPLRKLIPNDTLILAAETGELRARLYGPAGVLRYEANAALRSLVYNDLRLAGLDARSAGTIDRTGNTFGSFDLADASANVDLDYLAKGERIELRDVDLGLDYDTSNVAFRLKVDADSRREAEIGGRIDLRPDIRRVDFEGLSLRFDRDRWRLVQPASVSYGDRYVIRRFLLSSGDQQVAVDGVIDPRGEQNLVATIEDFRLGAVADWFGFKGLGGAISGQVDLTGPAEAPRLVGNLGMDVRAYDEPVGTMQVDLDYADRRLETEAVFTHRDGSTLTATGFVPLNLRLAPADAGTEATTGIAVEGNAQALSGAAGLDLAIRADRFAIDWIRPFLSPDQVRRLEGRLVADARVQGQLSRPELSGDVQLVEALVDLPALGVVYDRMNVDLELRGDAIEVQRLTARSGGTLTGSGRIAFPDLRLGEFDLALNLDAFRPIDNQVAVRRVSGPLALRGTLDRPRIEGDLRVDEAEYVLTETRRFDDVALTREDVMTVEQRFGIRVGRDSTVSETFQNMALDLRVALARDTWLRSRITPGLDIQMTGNVEVRKAAQAPLNLFGDVQVIPERSKIETLGRRFDVTTGRMTFNGPLQEVLVDVGARYDVRRPGSRETAAQITLTANGRPLVPGDLDIAFGSDPPMETADILSYIATGRPAEQTFAFGDGGTGGGFVETGAGLALSQLAGLLEGVAARELGLDVIEIEQDGINGTRLTAGKYLSPRLYASIAQPITYGTTANSTLRGPQATTVRLEYEVTDWLLSTLLYERSVLRVNLRWEYAY